MSDLIERLRAADGTLDAGTSIRLHRRAADEIERLTARLRSLEPQPMETAPRDGAWTYKVQHGPDGQADYAWLYRDDEMYAVMKTHHAAQVCAGMNTIPATPQKDDAA